MRLGSYKHKHRLEWLRSTPVAVSEPHCAADVCSVNCLSMNGRKSPLYLRAVVCTDLRRGRGEMALHGHNSVPGGGGWMDGLSWVMGLVPSARGGLYIKKTSQLYFIFFSILAFRGNKI